MRRQRQIRALKFVYAICAISLAPVNSNRQSTAHVSRCTQLWKLSSHQLPCSCSISLGLSISESEKPPPAFSTSEPSKVVFFFIENVNGGDEGLINLRWNTFTFTKLSIKYLSRKWCVNNKEPQIIYIYL